MYRKVVFSGGRDRTIVWVLSLIPIIVIFVCLWFVFGVYSSKEMHI